MITTDRQLALRIFANQTIILFADKPTQWPLTVLYIDVCNIRLQCPHSPLYPPLPCPTLGMFFAHQDPMARPNVTIGCNDYGDNVALNGTLAL